MRLVSKKLQANCAWLIPRLLALWAVCFSMTAAGQVVTRLAKGWEFYKGSIGSTWEIWRGEKASDNVKWESVDVPHCFNAMDAVDPDCAYYQGPGWYRTQLTIQNPFPNGRVLLHFQGVGQQARVYVGYEKVAEHTGGYDQWTVDITEAAKHALSHPDFNGKVPLAVLCDNSRNAEVIPSDLSDFTRYGGLYRHVDLEYVPAVSIERCLVEPFLDPKGDGSIKVRARLRDLGTNAAPGEFAIEIADPTGRAVFRSGDTRPLWSGDLELASLKLASVEPWSPDSPALYECKLRIKTPAGESAVRERFGFRSVDWKEAGPFSLNGRRLLLRGTQYHEDHAGTGAAVPDEVVRQTLKEIKDMGANFVRLGHYQQAPLVLDLCDELGLLVWEEIPWCRGGLGGDGYKEQCRRMLRNMIDQHYNHPSVILWGLGNENDWPGDFETFDTNAIRSFMIELSTLARKMDPSRNTAIRRCDFCKDVVDVYSPSIWAGWYSGKYQEYRGSAEKQIRGVPHFFHAEWGGDSLAGRHSEEPERFLAQVASGQGTAETGRAYKSTGGKARASKDGDWSESYIINLFDWHLKEQEQMPNLTGAAQWIFKDFSTPLRPENPIPRVNQKGLLERDGTRKESYYVFQSYWATKPMVHIYGHTWPVRWGKPGEPRLVKVFSNCREIELFVNGASQGTKTRSVTNYPAAGLRWYVVFQEGTNKLKAVARDASSELADEIELAYQTTAWGPPAQVTLTETGGSGSDRVVEARAFDAEGVACLDAAGRVRFGVAGDGVLLDNRGTAGGSRVVELANGRARISIRLKGVAAVASVSMQGLAPAFAYLTNAPLQASSLPSKASAVDLAKLDRERILKRAADALGMAPITITAHRAAHSKGGPNDFYSNADYWWPDPAKTDGLPYVQRDGQSNPGNFNDHRMAMRDLRDAVAALAAAYKITAEERYAMKAAGLLQTFFLDPKTRMNPHLEYAQAVPGRYTGRSYGIIDSLHLAEVPVAIRCMADSPSFTPELMNGLKKWFAEFSQWMVSSKNGREEAAAKNNHSVAFWVQIACFAQFTGDDKLLAEARRQYKEVFLPAQMAADGSFPLEMKRTKPYGYSIFQLDNMSILCHVLSTPEDDLWHYQLPDGRGIQKGVSFLFPFLADKSKWPLKPDIQAWESWPARQPCLLFAGLAFGREEYLDLWRNLPAEPSDMEVRRNIAITQPLLWVRADKAAARVAGTGSAQKDRAWRSLFNGKDLAGWVPMHRAQFAVTNGNLRLVSGMGWLRTERSYKNFQLELEWRALQPGYDSGIFLRTSGEENPWPAQAWQVNLSRAALGGLVKGTRTIVPAENPPAPVGKWLRFRIVAEGNSLRLDVDGEPAWSFDKFNTGAGFIGIQAEDSAFEFRNIRIRELPDR